MVVIWLAGIAKCLKPLAFKGLIPPSGRVTHSQVFFYAFAPWPSKTRWSAIMANIPLPPLPFSMWEKVPCQHRGKEGNKDTTILDKSSKETHRYSSQGFVSNCPPPAASAKCEMRYTVMSLTNLTLDLILDCSRVSQRCPQRLHFPLPSDVLVSE